MSLFPELHSLISQTTGDNVDEIDVIGAGLGRIDLGMGEKASLSDRQVAVIYSTFTCCTPKCAVLSIEDYRAAMKKGAA